MAIQEKIILTAEDRASHAFDRAGGSFEAMGSKILNLAKGAGLVAVGSQILDVVGNLDQLGLKMAANQRMADTVFAGMENAARKWADANNEAFGIGENAMLGLLAKTQDLLVPMGFARDVAFEMSGGILTVANALSEWEGGTITTTDAQLTAGQGDAR